MGWSSVSSVAQGLARSIMRRVSDKKLREKLYTDMVSILEDHDWDCVYVAEGIDPVLDKVIERLYPKDPQD